jgi:hypothetical protein
LVKTCKKFKKKFENGGKSNYFCELTIQSLNTFFVNNIYLNTRKFPYKIILLLLCVNFSVKAQQNSLHKKQIVAVSKGDTVQLDSLSLVPGTIQINKQEYKEGIDFIIQYSESKLIWLNETTTTFKIIYRVFPISFSEQIRNKDPGWIHSSQFDEKNPFIIHYTQKNASGFFETEGIEKSGNISRGVSFGNSQDVVLSSNLDLQLSGELSDGIMIKASITDNNIPIQPQGNTQQIEDFDKVYIELISGKTRLLAGDFETKSPDNYFMRFNKKAQGASFQNVYEFDNKKDSAALFVNVSAALSRGKTNRQEIVAVEGNLGPYKLKGSENETYIIILSGTEKVYIDGRLLTRGQENDYVIDYNTAEIIFTTKQIITKDSRIVVEFEYSDKNYSRSLLFANTEYQTKKGSFYVNFFNEQDMKNQPVQQELDDDQKMLLGSIGDSLNQAIVWGVDSVDFTNDLVLYKMTDTIGYDSVFVYSTNPDSAYYRLSFSFVGEGKGNYTPTTSAANGKVYTWIAPISGQAQGSYEPVVLLFTPKKTQMLTAGGNYKITKRLQTQFEFALSNNDINTFSTKDAGDNTGVAAKFDIQHHQPLGNKKEDAWAINSTLSYEFVEKNFTPLQQYRNIEFNRDWNIGKTKQKANEHIIGTEIKIQQKSKSYINYSFNYFNREDNYEANKNQLNAKLLNDKGTNLDINASIMQSENISHETFFLRQKVNLTQKFGGWTLGIKEEQEQNEFTLTNDSLGANSFSFFQWDASVNYADTNQRNFSISYGQRKDQLPYNNKLINTTFAENITANISLFNNPNNRLNINATYRKLEILDTNIIDQVAENTLLGRVEQYFKLGKGLFTSSSFYEIGNGMEVKKEFTYVEVPAGQGVYAWTDYNLNGVQELNEFDIAMFQDQANYIRVFTPTNEYVKTYTNQLREVINIQPAILWSNKEGWRKFVARFSDRLVYRVEHKTISTDPAKSYNPFYNNIQDTSMLTINSNIRNTLYFNRTHPVFGLEFDYQKNYNKMLMVNGFENRTLEKYSTVLRWNITRKIMLNTEGIMGDKTNTSEYFSSKNYELSQYSVKPKISIQPGTTYRLSLSYMYSIKENKSSIDREKAEIHDIGLEFKWNMPEKGSIMTKANYIEIAYNAEENTSLAYEMLQGLKTGKNITWNISYQRSVGKNMQLSIMYDGRKAGDNKIIHLGSMQLRAYF